MASKANSNTDIHSDKHKSVHKKKKRSGHKSSVNTNTAMNPMQSSPRLADPKVNSG